jgi:quercetin dioxygenase-like cupin family protein
MTARGNALFHGGVIQQRFLAGRRQLEEIADLFQMAGHHQLLRQAIAVVAERDGGLDLAEQIELCGGKHASLRRGTEESSTPGREQAEQSSGLIEYFEPDNPGMHATPTVDYGIVLEGEIWLELDDGKTVHLKTHDVIVQNGTRHAWRNKSSKPTKMAFVLIGQTSK